MSPMNELPFLIWEWAEAHWGRVLLLGCLGSWILAVLITCVFKGINTFMGHLMSPFKKAEIRVNVAVPPTAQTLSPEQIGTLVGTAVQDALVDHGVLRRPHVQELLERQRANRPTSLQAIMNDED